MCGRPGTGAVAPVVDGGYVVLTMQGVGLSRLQEIGRMFARCLRPGDLVFLEGPLGAGKTTFVRAVAGALRIKDTVRSPSFTIANVYAGPVTVQHLDLYRLERIEDEDALALEDYLDDDAITLVEWPEAGLGSLGDPTWVVRIDHESQRKRSLTIIAWSEEARARWIQAGGGE